MNGAGEKNNTPECGRQRLRAGVDRPSGRRPKRAAGGRRTSEREIDRTAPRGVRGDGAELEPSWSRAGGLLEPSWSRIGGELVASRWRDGRLGRRSRPDLRRRLVRGADVIWSRISKQPRLRHPAGRRGPEASAARRAALGGGGDGSSSSSDDEQDGNGNSSSRKCTESGGSGPAFAAVPTVCACQQPPPG